MARLCLALLRNLKHSHIVADKWVRNFDAVSYLNGQLRLSVFFCYRIGRHKWLTETSDHQLYMFYTLFVNNI